MSHSVIQATPQLLNEAAAYYKKSAAPKLPQGAVFSAKVDGCTVTGYKSGKILFQGSRAEEESRRWGGTGAAAPAKSAAKTVHGFAPPPNIAGLSAIGSDEVGTGDFFGPMTVTAAYVSKEQLPLLKEMGVRDSKGLKDPQITAIAKDLIKTIPYSLLVLKNEKYNEMQSKGMTQGKMKAWLHNQAIRHLMDKISPEEPEAILIDQFVDPNIYFNHLRGQTYSRKNTYFSTKAEGIHLAVAAASIIARYSFVKEFEKLSKAAGMTLPKGAGKQVDEAAAKLISKQGEEVLHTYAKTHFANKQKALDLLRRKR
ncbi:ribonuclease HIII [Bacillus mangrovi]|uniref:Ribonuclease HIII n=1 Tax=Metabacillus mangrovi TaxID=1491830 RepID=A0A7X2S3C6_9BACI|nr:ribonuclease HIII [Metabacillus mangrovi]MTH52907.1 ribonuclease HIII [Metabacillus mangrovi]